MEIRCEFGTDYGYTCKITSKEILENSELIFNGIHKTGKCDNDVEAIHFRNCITKIVPQGLTKKFPNLTKISIEDSNLKKISKNDLAEYKFLQKLQFENNEIDFLPGDLFEDFKKLEEISFKGNKLTVVEPNILDGLDKLKNVNLDGNVNYGSFSSYYTVSQSDSKFVKTKLKQKFYKHDSQVLLQFPLTAQAWKILVQEFQQSCKKLQKTNDELENENRNLKAVELELTRKNENLTKNIQNLNQENQNFKNSQEASARQIQALHLREQKLTQQVQNLKLELEKQKIKNAANNSKFSADIKNIIQSENFKDFKIKIDDREFHVHKFLLAAQSPTLAEILQNNPDAENLNLVDISVENFEKILKFLYTDELPREDGTNFLHLFAAAGRLKIEELKNFAAQKILTEIDGKNALEILNLANKYGHDEMRQKAFDEIKKKYTKIEFKDEWISDGEKISKMIDFFKKMEEFEENLKKSMELN